MNELDIISTHLGKAGDGSVVKPYVTPTAIDASLLVPVPRTPTRTAYGIHPVPEFCGYDVWNAYEFSALTDAGLPVVARIKIVYTSYSECIVESKSLKLYLNSFNMVRLGPDVKTVVDAARGIIAKDLSAALNGTVLVFIHTIADIVKEHQSFNAISGGYFTTLDNMKVTGGDFVYEETPDLLVVDTNATAPGVQYHVAALRSNCRVTNQPDWGDVYMYMRGDKLPTAESFLRYIVSMRNENHFHEEICECIYKRLSDKFSPQELFVGCLYTRRGGIDINPVRASSVDLLEIYAARLLSSRAIGIKTWRQ